MHTQLIAWFRQHARALPWRDPETTPWSVLVSEFMAQQTQVERVAPRYLEWITRWPKPSALAVADPGDAVRAWDRLGYPRRALWLHRAAATIATDHADTVPRDVPTLLTLTGVGPYTARAVAVFAYGDRHPVVDTNTRRVLARVLHGRAAAGMPSPSNLDDMLSVLPKEREPAAIFNAAMMELGATVCTARAPQCGSCPIAKSCAWRQAGYPDNAPKKRPRQARYEGSDRMARGVILAALRSAPGPIAASDLQSLVSDEDQASRALRSLIADGLAIESESGVALP